MKDASYTWTIYQIRGKTLLKRLILYVLALLMAFWLIAPFVWLFIYSISTQADLLLKPLPLIPPRPTLEHYENIFGLRKWNAATQAAKILPAIINSSIVALSVTIINLVIGALAGYGFARYEFRGKRLTLMTLLFTRMLPTVVLMLPFFMIFRHLNLINTRWALIITYTSFALPFTVWIMKAYFETIPRELERSAYVDGCTKLQAYVKVILPVSGPGLIAAGIFTFMLSWNEFILALILTKTTDSVTLPPVIAGLNDQVLIDYASIAAGGFVSTVPAVILVLLFQKYMIQGLITGSVKG